jgi:hypothetical protein
MLLSLPLNHFRAAQPFVLAGVPRRTHRADTVRHTAENVPLEGDRARWIAKDTEALCGRIRFFDSTVCVGPDHF